LSFRPDFCYSNATAFCFNNFFYFEKKTVDVFLFNFIILFFFSMTFVCKSSLLYFYSMQNISVPFSRFVFFILTNFFCSIIFFIPKNMSSFFYYIILYDYFCTVLFYSTEIIKRFFRMILLVYCLKHQIYSFFFHFHCFFSSWSTYLRITCDCVQKFIYRILYYFVFTNMTYSI